MLSEALRRYAEGAWEKVKEDYVNLNLEAELADYQGDVGTLLTLALGTLPASDVASVPLGVLASYAQHACMLRATSAYCRDIPEDIFVHCVFYPRINSEDLTECRPFFYSMVEAETRGLDGVEAALAVNRWCAAQMTYESTDQRTISPMTAFSCGLGRCGEESTFAVTALRSVGIPARQIYAPWWSHCDDNHAWVEVYVQGQWHFLGACEPEPILDRGWFSSAASRAMVVFSRNYFDFVGAGLASEELVGRQGSCLLYNQVGRYAQTARVSISTVPGAWVRFSVLNMAAPREIAALQADETGLVTLELGLGSCLAEAEKDGLFAWRVLEIKENTVHTLIPGEKTPRLGQWDWDFAAPAAGSGNRRVLTAAQAREKAEVLKAAGDARLERLASYWSDRFLTGDEALDRGFRAAGGNAGRLWSFYRLVPGAGELLKSLSIKDWRDADPAVLDQHLAGVQSLEMVEGFVPYVLCPRIGFEVLSPWRQAVQAALTQEQKNTFRASPQALWAWIGEHFREKNLPWQPGLWLQPDAALGLGAADAQGRRLLFVAVLRTLGVPARLDPVDGKAQYWASGTFVTVETASPRAVLRIDAPEPVHGQSWTLSRWEGGWQLLELAGNTGSLPHGRYRLVTVNRLPNGNQLARVRVFDFRGDLALTAQRRQGHPEQMLARYPVTLPESLPGKQLQMYLEVGAEPTEHGLNELLEAADRLERGGLGLLLLVPEEKALRDPTLEKVRNRLPWAVIRVTDFESAALEALARSLYLEPGLWPLTVLTDGTTACYGQAGYCVGSVPLALDLAKLL